MRKDGDLSHGMLSSFPDLKTKESVDRCNQEVRMRGPSHSRRQKPTEYHPSHRKWMLNHKLRQVGGHSLQKSQPEARQSSLLALKLADKLAERLLRASISHISLLVKTQGLIESHRSQLSIAKNDQSLVCLMTKSSLGPKKELSNHLRGSSRANPRDRPSPVISPYLLSLIL